MCSHRHDSHIVANLQENFSEPEATPARPHPLLGDDIFVLNCILKQEVPGRKIIDYSSNEKVKHEKQRRNIMYMLFGRYVYIYP